MKDKKSVCVIGAGLSGLITIKELLDEEHEVVCLESASGIGGVFNTHLAADWPGYENVELTVSNYYMAYSCFPPPNNEERRYWSLAEYASYLESFTEAYGLRPHILFNVSNLSVGLDSLYASDEKVRVTFKYEGNELERLFDSVCVCSGQNQMARLPEFTIRGEFTGSIIHTKDYNTNAPFHGKKVIAIGIGESGADVVREIAEVADECTLSFRHFPHIGRKYSGPKNKHTTDAHLTRIIEYTPQVVREFVIGTTIRLGSKVSDSAFMRLGQWNQAAGGFLSQFFTKNDYFFEKIMDDSLQYNASGIDYLQGDRVFFKDGASAQADFVVCNTGYQTQFDFLNFPHTTNVRDLFKHMLHVDYGARISFIGFVRPTLGSVPACSEMQARYLAGVLAGKLQLPSRPELHREIEYDRRYERNYFSITPDLHTLTVFPVFMDSMARKIGCMPDVGLLQFLKDPRLFYKLWCGSLLPEQYRFRGPHNDPEMAKEVIKRLPTGLGKIAIMWSIVQFFACRLLDGFGMFQRYRFDGNPFTWKIDK